MHGNRWDYPHCCKRDAGLDLARGMRRSSPVIRSCEYFALCAAAAFYPCEDRAPGCALRGRAPWKGWPSPGRQDAGGMSAVGLDIEAPKRLVKEAAEGGPCRGFANGDMRAGQIVILRVSCGG